MKLCLINPFAKERQIYILKESMPTWEPDNEPVKTRTAFIRCMKEVITRLTAVVTE